MPCSGAAPPPEQPREPTGILELSLRYTDRKDLAVITAYLRLKSIRQTSYELQRSREEVRAAIGRFRLALERCNHG